MTRDEEIRNAKHTFYERIYEEGYYYDPRDCFEEGAEWADKHPINVWHDTNDIPQKEELILIQCFGFNFVLLVFQCYLANMWEVWCREKDVKQWAYIRDLLPKQS